MIISDDIMYLDDRHLDFIQVSENMGYEVDYQRLEEISSVNFVTYIKNQLEEVKYLENAYERESIIDFLIDNQQNIHVNICFKPAFINISILYTSKNGHFGREIYS